MAVIAYCFLDVEVDGPTPGANSMLELGPAAFDEVGHELDIHRVLIPGAGQAGRFDGSRSHDFVVLRYVLARARHFAGGAVDHRASVLSR